VRKGEAAHEQIVPLAIAAALVLGMLLFLPWLALAKEASRRTQCRSNMAQIGRALQLYAQSSGYMPFACVPSGSAPTASRTSRYGAICDASLSLALLYPQYLTSAQVFGCPCTEDMPALTLVPGGATEGATASAAAWTLGYAAPTWPSYGYDPRVGPRASPAHAVLADMDGTFCEGSDRSTWNHDGGQNVLYLDGHVAWCITNFASIDPNDNIFAEAYRPGNPAQGWHADTDSFMVRGSIALTSSCTWAEFSSLW
jgi:prepilin-type processing-associated H-X9-DG protein